MDQHAVLGVERVATAEGHEALPQNTSTLKCVVFLLLLNATECEFEWSCAEN